MCISYYLFIRKITLLEEKSSLWEINFKENEILKFKKIEKD